MSQVSIRPLGSMAVTDEVQGDRLTNVQRDDVAFINGVHQIDQAFIRVIGSLPILDDLLTLFSQQLLHLWASFEDRTIVPVMSLSSYYSFVIGIEQDDRLLGNSVLADPSLPDVSFCRHRCSEASQNMNAGSCGKRNLSPHRERQDAPLLESDRIAWWSVPVVRELC